MTKLERINQAVEKLAAEGIELKKSEVETILKVVDSMQTNELYTTGTATTPFGIVKIVYRKAKDGVNPRTQEHLTIPERLGLKLSVIKQVKDELAQLPLDNFRPKEQE